MSRPLPEDRDKALEAIAAGWGRQATRAHPLCTCDQPTPDPPCPEPDCQAADGATCTDLKGHPMPPHRTRPRPRLDARPTCPVHERTP